MSGEKEALGRTEETSSGTEYSSVGDETQAVAWDVLKKSLDNKTGKRNPFCRDEVMLARTLTA